MEWLLVLLISMFSCALGQTVEYSDLQAMGVACSPRDTCSTNAVHSFFTSNCECDRSCHSFGDCCVDAYRNTRRSRAGQVRLGLTCQALEPLRGVYAVGKCSRNWNGSDEIRFKCENHDDFSDPLISVPATNSHTNVTYRNRYCAECNYANLVNISAWYPALTCSSLQVLEDRYQNITLNYILQNIVRVDGSWGVYQWNQSLGGMSFYPCEVSFKLPDNLRPHVRFCRPNVISTCARNYSRPAIRNKCPRYMAVIYIGGQAYRNAHCALCNHVSSLNNIICDMAGITVKAKPSLSFTLLLDVNPSDGDEVGRTNPCRSGETFDPYFNKCRALVCALPNHVYRNGRCVPQ